MQIDSVHIAVDLLVFIDRGTGMSYSAPKVVQLKDYILTTKEDTPLVFVVSLGFRSYHHQIWDRVL